MSDEDLLMPGKPLKNLDGPAFDQPWQARAFALVLNMHKAGLFEWKDWAERLSAEIKMSPTLPDESVNDGYYRQWMAALESMVASLGLIDRPEVTSRAEQWRKAYLNTPHGVPISLCNAENRPDDYPVHIARREPIAVFPGLG